MAISSTKTDVHWNYFLSVEADLERLSRFIEFDEQNYQCFSVENTRILIAAGAEVEVVCKQLCRKLNSETTVSSINQYRDEIIPKCSFPSFEVLAPRYGLRLKPWVNWGKSNGIPDWWTAYNKMKHHRATEYHRASLKNVLNAVAGLYVACLYLYQDKARFGELAPDPCILRPSENIFMGTRLGGYERAIVYKFED